MSNLTGFVKRLRDTMRNDAGIDTDVQRLAQIVWMLFLKVYDAKEQDWEWDDEEYTSIIPEECRWQNWAHDDKSGTALTGDKLLDFVNNKLFPTLKNLPVDASTPVNKAIVQTVFADANQYMKEGVLLRQVINVIDELDFSDYKESHAFGEIYETILKELQSAGSAGEFYTPRAVTDFMAQIIKPQIGETMADFACGTGGFIVSWLKELHKQVKTTEDEEAYSNSIYGVEKKALPFLLCATNMLLHDIGKPFVWDSSESLSYDRFDDHAAVSAKLAGKILRDLKYDNATRKDVVELIAHHNDILLPDPVNVRRALARLGEVQTRRLVQVKVADLIAHDLAGEREKILTLFAEISDVIDEVVARGDCTSVKALAIGGQDMMALGLSGRAIGQMLNAALELVLEKPEMNTRETLLNWVRGNLENCQK